MSKIQTLVDVDNFIYYCQTLEPEMLLDDELADEINWSIWQMHSIISTLEVVRPYDKLKELKEYKERLTKLIEIIEKPF